MEAGGLWEFLCLLLKFAVHVESLLREKDKTTG